jgi:NADH-quinone oxidoreductase subunit E
MEIPTETKKLIEQRVAEIRQRYPDAQAACLPALHVAQGHVNYVSEDVLELVAEMLSLPTAYVQGVATFYTMYNKASVGRYHLQLCTNVSCLLHGAQELLAGLEDHLGIKTGQTTKDGMFTLAEVECLAACGTAPVLQVNDKYYEEMDLEQAKTLIERLRAKADSTSIGEGEPTPNASVPAA